MKIMSWSYMNSLLDIFKNYIYSTMFICISYVGKIFTLIC